MNRKIFSFFVFSTGVIFSNGIEKLMGITFSARGIQECNELGRYLSIPYLYWTLDKFEAKNG
jgi:hypothetical protein